MESRFLMRWLRGWGIFRLQSLPLAGWVVSRLHMCTLVKDDNDHILDILDSCNKPLHWYDISHGTCLLLALQWSGNTKAWNDKLLVQNWKLKQRNLINTHFIQLSCHDLRLQTIFILNHVVITTDCTSTTVNDSTLHKHPWLIKATDFHIKKDRFRGQFVARYGCGIKKTPILE